jgi:hypothetical protein
MGIVDCGQGEGREEEACRPEDDEKDHRRPGTVLSGGSLRSRDGAEPMAAAGDMVALNMVVGACVAGFLFGGLVGAALVYYYLKNKKPGSLGCGGGSGNGVVGSPHYISAKSQNLYVSLPMLDLKHKQLSSNASDYSGTLRSNATGTLRSSKAGGGGSSIYSGGGGGGSSKPGDYETATIKRSHSRRDSSLLNGLMGGNTIRADLDSDTLFT